MILKYGSYTHSGMYQVMPSISYLIAPNGSAYAKTTQYRIDGTLVDPSSSGLLSKISALHAAYAVQGNSLLLSYSSGASTDINVSSSATLSGVRVINPPALTEGAKSSYAATYPYSLTLEAVEDIASGNPTIEFSESYDIAGSGGSRKVLKNPLEGEIVPQIY